MASDYPDWPPTIYDLDRWFPGHTVPRDANVHYVGSWCDYSFGDLLVVFEHGGKFFISDDDELQTFNEVSPEDALQEMLDFEEVCEWT